MFCGKDSKNSNNKQAPAPQSAHCRPTHAGAEMTWCNLATKSLKPPNWSPNTALHLTPAKGGSTKTLVLMSPFTLT